jgi:site-specific DNA recombinase
LDEQVVAMLATLRQPDVVRDWFARNLQRMTQQSLKDNTEKASEYQRELTTLRNQQDRLVNLYTLGEIDVESYWKKNTEFRDRIAAATLRLEAVDRRRDENAELATKVFELSQDLHDQWFTANYAVKRRILSIVCLNFSLVDVSVVPEWRKPFDRLAKGASQLRIYCGVLYWLFFRTWR